ncbi:MAG: hypothetical protein PGN09_06165 [Sphingomonas fennica]
MHAYTRALVAAAAYALVSGRKVAGVYDHAGGRHLRIAAEARDGHVQGYDGDRAVRFGGSLPELRDVGVGTAIHMTVDGATVRGFDRGAAGHFTGEVTDGTVQLYVHAEGVWYAFGIQSV